MIFKYGNMTVDTRKNPGFCLAFNRGDLEALCRVLYAAGFDHRPVVPILFARWNFLRTTGIQQ